MKLSEIEHIIRSQEVLITNLQEKIEKMKSGKKFPASENTVLEQKMFLQLEKQLSEENEQEMGLLHETEVSQPNHSPIQA